VHGSLHYDLVKTVVNHVTDKVAYTFQLDRAEVKDLDTLQHAVFFAGSAHGCALRAALDSMVQVRDKCNSDFQVPEYGKLVAAVIDELALVTDQPFRLAHLQSHLAKMQAKARAKTKQRCNARDRYSFSSHRASG